MTRGALAVAASETRRFYRQPFAWVVLLVGEALMATMYFLFIIRYLDNQAELAAAGVTVEVLMRYFGIAFLSVLVMTPLLTMSVLAGDRRDGQLRFLFSTPLSTSALVLGKFAGVLSLLLGYVVLAALMPLTLLWGAAIDLGVYLSNVLGLVLFTLMHGALGLAASALVRTPVGAGLIALGAGLALWTSEWAGRIGGDAALVSLSTLRRTRGFAQGLLAGGDVAYFLCATVAFVLIAILLVDADRSAA
ncbi:MAG: ABC transporter permease [Gammaproteobacteria bacterium]